MLILLLMKMLLSVKTLTTSWPRPRGEVRIGQGVSAHRSGIALVVVIATSPWLQLLLLLRESLFESSITLWQTSEEQNLL